MNLLCLPLTGVVTFRDDRLPVRVKARRDRLLAIKRGEAEWTEVKDLLDGVFIERLWRRLGHPHFGRLRDQVKRVT